jgi:hypothetical protein
MEGQMPFDVVSPDQAQRLLQELYNFREKLIFNLSKPQELGNLEEQHNDRNVFHLAAVQGCIVATREYLGTT